MLLQTWCAGMLGALHELAALRLEIETDAAKEHTRRCRQVFDEIQDKRSEIVILGEKYSQLLGTTGTANCRESFIAFHMPVAANG